MQINHNFPFHQKINTKNDLGGGRGGKGEILKSKKKLVTDPFNLSRNSLHYKGDFKFQPI